MTSDQPSISFVLRYLALAKYRMDFIQNCFRSFGIYNSWHLLRLLNRTESESGQPINIPAEFAGAPLLLRSGTSDVEAFYKIFAWKEYHLPPEFLPGRVRSIVDLGANIGFSVFYFASQFPGAQIIGLEPDSENYQLLEMNTRNIKRLNLVNAGIWSRRASLRIENPHDRPDSYRVCECPPGAPGSIPAYSVPDLMETYHLDEIDILKVDVEGAERQIFTEGCEAWLPKVRTLIIELHGEETRQQLIPRLTRILRQHFRQCENDVFVR
jgi:FkbM family methyltransferase